MRVGVTHFTHTPSVLFSSPGRSPGRAIGTTPGVAGSVGGSVSKEFNVKVFYVMGKELSGELSCPFVPLTGLVILHDCK